MHLCKFFPSFMVYLHQQSMLTASLKQKDFILVLCKNSFSESISEN